VANNPPIPKRREKFEEKKELQHVTCLQRDCRERHFCVPCSAQGKKIQKFSNLN
jgi:hypothetical protein